MVEAAGSVVVGVIYLVAPRHAVDQGLLYELVVARCIWDQVVLHSGLVDPIGQGVS